MTLGYSASEAAAAVGKLDSALPPEELIRLALKSFGSGNDHHLSERRSQYCQWNPMAGRWTWRRLGL